MKQLFAAAVLALSPLAASADTPFRLGVQTHFEQGWPISLIAAAKALGATLLRDEITWAEVESTPGSYDFTKPDLYLGPIAAAGMQMQLVTMDGHPVYDGGMTPYTNAGRAAYAGYLAAVAQQYAGTISLVELGNEVNSGEFLRGPYADDPARMLAAQARALRGALPPQHKLICAGTNTVAIGFLRQFFRYGGLQACDGISIHPYRQHPETLDLDLARLTDLMREMGGARPLYATEFGIWTEDPATSGPWMLKMVAIMGAAGVEEAIWYALVDEPYWPNMGLLDKDGGEKPAAASFRLLQDLLLPLGRPSDLSPSRRSRIYGFGTEAYVIWGSGEAVKIAGAERALDAHGREIPIPQRLTDAPVIILGAEAAIEIADAPAAHDSLYEYGTGPWSYYARRPEIGLTPLEVIDDRWTSYRSAPDLAPLRVTDDWLTTARFAEGPFHVVERFTAPAAGRYRISGTWAAAPDQEPATLQVLRGAEEIARGDVAPTGYALPAFELTLTEGEGLDFDLAAAGPKGVSSVSRRIRISGPLAADTPAR